MTYTITKEQNKYKKHLKWHLISTSESGTFHDWCTSEKKAIEKKEEYIKKGY